VTTVGWQLQHERAYALEGSAFVAGAAVQWLRSGLGLAAVGREIEALARSVPDSGGVVVVPAFAGLGAPHWRPHARGLISGLTRGTTKAHLARAVLEGIALQNVDILRAMEHDAGQPLRELKVDGGAAANDLLMQFQADVLGVRIRRPQQLESTAFGAAFLAGLGVGLWPHRRRVLGVGQCLALADPHPRGSPPYTSQTTTGPAVLDGARERRAPTTTSPLATTSSPRTGRGTVALEVDRHHPHRLARCV
jgi:glycerol kinase